MSSNIAKLSNALAASGLQRLQPDIERMMLPSLRLTGTPATGTLSAGTSRLGGVPDLPVGFTWPVWKSSPMSFLAQLRLEELAALSPASLLPKSGMLSFFYDAAQETYGADPADRGGWLVAYFGGDPGGWLVSAFPAALPAEARFSACTLQFSIEDSLPSSPAQHLPAPGWSEAEVEAYQQFLFDYPGAEERARPHHRMFGHPDQLQDDMQLQCALYANGFADLNDPKAAPALSQKEDWLLLLQVDSDDQAGMQWASAGRLYFWIESGALQAGQFERCWLVLQSD